MPRPRLLLLATIALLLSALVLVRPAASQTNGPAVLVGSVTVTEGDEGETTEVTVNVTLSESSDEIVTADWTTESLSFAEYAVAPDDYTAASGTLVFEPGVVAQQVTIVINGDDLDEDDETVLVATGNYDNAVVGAERGIGYLTIEDDDETVEPEPLTVTPTTNEVGEGDAGTVIGTSIPVILSEPSDVEVRVDWTTFDASGPRAASAADGDYVPRSGTLVFAPGETVKFASVLVNGDDEDEDNEYIAIATFNHVNAVAGGFYGLGFATIIDDDPPVTVEGGMVSFTFDDGHQTHGSIVAPALEERGWNGTFYITTSYLDGGVSLSGAQVVALHENGHEIGSHGVTHRSLTNGGLTAGEVYGELTESKTLLEDLTGAPVSSYATPYGNYNQVSVIRAIEETYPAHRGVNAGFNRPGATNPYLIRVQNVRFDTPVAQVEAWMDEAEENGWWLVLVYHRIVEDSPFAYDTSPANFTAHLDAAAARDLEVVTVREGLGVASGDLPAKPEPTPEVTATPESTVTPDATPTPVPTLTPEPPATVEPSATVEPTVTPTPTATTESTPTPEPSGSPTPTATPEFVLPPIVVVDR